MECTDRLWPRSCLLYTTDAADDQQTPKAVPARPRTADTTETTFPCYIWSVPTVCGPGPVSYTQQTQPTICRLQRPFPPVPEQRTQLKPLFPATYGVYRPFVAQVDVFPNDQALRVLIRQNSRARGPRFAHHVGSPRIV